jgi:DNA-binding MarR family transcriptional regulator
VAKEPWSSDPPNSRHIPQGNIAELVDYIRKARGLRLRFLDPQLFGEPAWDMLLDLYRAELAQQRIAIGSVCIGSGVPMTTALRWLKAMEAKGLVQRRPSPNDLRRTYVELTPEATAAMNALFVAIAAQLPERHRSP